MRPDNIEIVFDRYPPSGKGLNLTLGIPYSAEKVSEDGLYLLRDNDRKPFNVSVFGRSRTNGGNWHIVGEEVDDE